MAEKIARGFDNHGTFKGSGFGVLSSRTPFFAEREAAMATDIIPTAVAVHKFLKKSGTYEQVKNFILRRIAYPIVVVGASGAGKTSLVQSLFGEPSFIRRQDRSDSVREITARLEKRLFIKLIDTPGEVQHEAKRQQAFRQAMRYGSVGVLNVVAYGYHEGSIPKDHAITAKGNASKEFLVDRRKIERALLNEWVHTLYGEGGPGRWVVTVVTKADLWWKDSPEQPAMEYYKGADYISALAEAGSLPHSVKSYSSVRHLFYDQMPMSGYYSDQQRAQDNNLLIAHILEKVSEHG
jgi:50S ribosome-binding GTPase